MATLTVQTITTAGLEPTYVAAAAGGDQAANDGRVLLAVKTGATAITVTIDSPVACSQSAYHDAVVSVGANKTMYFGPFPPARWNSDGYVVITYSAVTSVTVAALKLP